MTVLRAVLPLLAAAALATPCAPIATPAVAQAMPATEHEQKPAIPSTELTVHTAGRAVTLFPADLQALPQATVQVFNAHSKQNETYTGPLLSDVLAKAGLPLSEATQHAILDSYLTARGTDGYFVVFSGAELQPGLHKGQVLVALTKSGQPLTRTGAFQLIDTEDVKPARWVHNLNSLSVVPVQASAP